MLRTLTKTTRLNQSHKLTNATKNSFRSIWTTSTIIANSPNSLLSQLSSHSSVANSPTSTLKPDVTLFTITKNVPPQIIEEILEILNPTSSTSSSNAVSSTKGTVIGCLSEVLPSSLSEHLASSILSSNSTTTTKPTETFSISLASFTPSTPSQSAIPFTSALTGRPNISVGREIKTGPRSDTAGETLDGGFAAFLSGERWGFGEGPGEGKRGIINELEGVKEQDVKQILYFTADRIQPFLTALAKYTSSSTLGLVGSSTPFHSATGAPYSLYYNSKLTSAGAVGVAIVDSSVSLSSAKPIEVDYSGLSMLGSKMEVTSAKGNIILTLSEQNAARLLLKAVQDLPPSSGEDAVSRGAEKDKEFFAAVFENDPGMNPDYSTARHISRIMAGDPSRGAMSVSTEEEVKNGYWVIFLHRPHSSPPVSHLLSQPSASTSFQFLSIAGSKSYAPSFSSSKISEGSAETIPGFITASENGVILSRRGSESWVCGTEGTVAKME